MLYCGSLSVSMAEIWGGGVTLDQNVLNFLQFSWKIWQKSYAGTPSLQWEILDLPLYVDNFGCTDSWYEYSDHCQIREERTRNTCPQVVQTLSFSCSCWHNMCKIIGQHTHFCDILMRGLSIQTKFKSKMCGSWKLDGWQWINIPLKSE